MAEKDQPQSQTAQSRRKAAVAGVAETQVPSRPFEPPAPSQRPRMIGWFDPGQLARTGTEVLVSALFGRHADYRLIEALADADRDPCDFTEHEDSGVPRDEIWIDYVADVGDGWDSTYAVAYYLTRPELSFDEKDRKITTRRADILVFGGDQVYPTPSRERYEQRLVAPYETAMPSTEPPHPAVFAVPGNHDWYDSLASFTRLFTAHGWFAGWKTRQSRSYFALRLPHGWWLLGVDIQLGSDIDRPQLEYFEGIGKQMQEGDRVILCTAEPHWVYATRYGEVDANYSESNLALLEQRLGQNRVVLFLAGDLHHYARHELQQTGVQKITAGGGGAFLHATHKPDDKSLKGGFELRAAFPDRDTSWRLTWKNLLFPWINPKFGLATGAIYVITAWLVAAGLWRFQWPDDFGPAVKETSLALLARPIAALWVAALWWGFVFFTDTHFKWYRRIAATAHVLAHLLMAFFLSWWAARMGVRLWGTESHHLLRLLFCAAVVFGGGWGLGAILMGLYLLLSHNGFGRHSNESFSALRIVDWKNFVRMRIDAKGLTIFPVGIKRVPRKWRRGDAGPTEPKLVPDPADRDATAPHLIEAEIVLKKPSRAEPPKVRAVVEQRKR
jgi:Calcineurin-like phosphoesterase